MSGMKKNNPRPHSCFYDTNLFWSCWDPTFSDIFLSIFTQQCLTKMFTRAWSGDFSARVGFWWQSNTIYLEWKYWLPCSTSCPHFLGLVKEPNESKWQTVLVLAFVSFPGEHVFLVPWRINRVGCISLTFSSVLDEELDKKSLFNHNMIVII